jgi:hypothetical protein
MLRLADRRKLQFQATVGDADKRARSHHLDDSSAVDDSGSHE